MKYDGTRYRKISPRLRCFSSGRRRRIRKNPSRRQTPATVDSIKRQLSYFRHRPAGTDIGAVCPRSQFSKRPSPTNATVRRSLRRALDLLIRDALVFYSVLFVLFFSGLRGFSVHEQLFHEKSRYYARGRFPEANFVDPTSRSGRFFVFFSLFPKNEGRRNHFTR